MFLTVVIIISYLYTHRMATITFKLHQLANSLYCNPIGL